MRNIRLVGGLAAAVCVLAVGAAPAMAHQFVASKTGKTAGRGFEEIIVEKGVAPEFEPARMQEWRLGAFRILCYKATGAGEVTEGGSETFTTTTKYSKCGWYPQATNTLHVGAGFSKTGIQVIYHANGYTEAVGNGEGEEYEFKKAEVLETSAFIKISSTKLCKIVIPAQTIPVRAISHPGEEFSSAVFSNTEFELKTGVFQKRLVIQNEFKKMKFKYAGEETQCTSAPEFEKLSEEGGGGSAGVYKGSLEERLVGGSLSWE
ncbi:MAG: hypothetical protein JWN81_2888 [Solirubrobacterales bacterium]|jgi:hypothetical protein|nr:hypothetical protein [Solirubrobacterales bacterium]